MKVVYNRISNKVRFFLFILGEFAPVASNDSHDGKAKNRRIEVILTPKLDEISNLLKGM